MNRKYLQRICDIANDYKTSPVQLINLSKRLMCKNYFVNLEHNLEVIERYSSINFKLRTDNKIYWRLGSEVYFEKIKQ